MLPSCNKCATANLPCEGYRGLPVTFDPHVQRLNRNNTTQAPMAGQQALQGILPVNHNATGYTDSSSRKLQAFQADQGILPVNHNPTAYTDSSSRKLLLSNHNHANDHATTVIKRPPRGRPRKNSPLTKKMTNGITKRNNFDQSSPVPTELDLSAFQEPICVTFLVQNFLGQLDTGRKSLLPAWDVDNVAGTARSSINALALAFFGKAHHQQNIIDQGSDCYRKALRKLAHDLHDPQAMWSPSVLLSSILLARYELVASTGSEGWIQHAGGVERMFELRGPQRHQSLEERQIFEAARPIIAIKAITDCKRTFLDQEDWQTIPWAQDPSQKSSMNLLIDIFCVIPGLLEESKRLRNSTSFIWDYKPPTSPSIDPSAERPDPRLVALRHRTQACHAQLQRWKEAWDKKYPSALHPVKISSFSQPDLNFPEDIFSYAIDFPSFLRAAEYQLYNTVVFFLSTLMLSVPPTSQGDLVSSPPGELMTERYEAAYNICRAVPYDLSSEKHGGGGAYLLLFPLLTTLRLFGAGSPEGKWIKHVLGSIANKWGLEGEQKYMLLEG